MCCNTINRNIGDNSADVLRSVHEHLWESTILGLLIMITDFQISDAPRASQYDTSNDSEQSAAVQ